MAEINHQSRNAFPHQRHTHLFVSRHHKYGQVASEGSTAFASRTSKASTSWWVKNMEFRDDRLAIAKRGALLCSFCNGQSPVGAAGLGGFFLASGSSSIGAVAKATANSLISRCILMEDMAPSKSSFRQAAAAACCWASLGGLTNKAGMSFSFRGMMLATPRSIKDSR